MRIVLTLIILVNLCVFASALDRSRLQDRHSRIGKRNEGAGSDASITQTRAASIQNQAATQSRAATQAATTQTVTKAATQAVASVASVVTSNKDIASTDAKAVTTTTTLSQTKTATTAKSGSAAAVTEKKIEHVTQEPAPPGMVRPVLVPPPDAIPSSFTVKPQIQGGGMAPALKGNVFSPQFTEKGKSSDSDDDDDDDDQEESESQSTQSTQDSKGYWHSHGGGSAVTAQEVQSLSDEANTDDSFPPKYPPCSPQACQIEMPPPCCMTMPPAPYSRGYWHQNGHMHFHHVHSTDESPEQIMQENEADQQADAQPQVEQGDAQDDQSDQPQPQTDATPATQMGGGETAAAGSTADVVEAGNLSSTASAASETLSVALVGQMIQDALVKNHGTIVADLSSRLDQLKAEMESQLKSLGDSLAAVVNGKGIPGPRGPKGERGDPSVVIVHDGDHHHHHHHHDDDDDVPSTAAFTSSGSTIEILKSMEASSEDLTKKLDQADVLDKAAAGESNGSVDKAVDDAEDAADDVADESNNDDSDT